MVVVVSFCIVSYLGQMANFENQRDSEYQRHAREVSTLIKDSSKNLRQIVETIPFLENMSSALREDNGENVKLVFDQHWPLLQFHNKVEFVRFYSTSGQLTASWGIYESSTCEFDAVSGCEEDALTSWVDTANQIEQPLSPILCKDRCEQLIIAPILVHGEKTGVVAMGVSLADAFLKFKSISDADIGLFVKPQEDFSNDSNTLMPDWGVRIIALTNRKINLEA